VLESHRTDILYNWVRSGDTLINVLSATISLNQPLIPTGTAIKWIGTTHPATPADQTLQSRVAHLGMIMPFTNNGVELEGIAWKQVTCGAKLAVSHVNSGDETIVPGLRALITNLQRLDSSIYDTGCIMGLGSKHPFHSCHPAITHMAMARLLCADSASPGLFSYRQMVQAGAHAMIGAARSAVSMPLAQLGALDVMPQCSYWSSSPSLSDTQLYPYCASSLAPCLQPQCLTHAALPHAPS
jgi:hypothetical protein